MALTTTLLVKIAGNADGLISSLAKTGKQAKTSFKEVSSAAQVEFEKMRKVADTAYKDVARLQKQAVAASKAGRTDLASAFEGQAARRAVEADAAASAVVAAEKRIAAEAIKTGAITKTALASGASGAGAAFAREGGAIQRVFGQVQTSARQTGAAIKEGLSSGAFSGAGKVAAGVGAGLIAGFTAATKATLTFDKQLSSTRAVLQGSEEDMQALRKAALDAGAATVFSATEAAAAETELAKAGISLEDILSGGLSGALNLAAAGQLELADAATIAAQAMTTFGLSGGDVEHIADVLAAAANSSTASVASLAEGLSESGGVAKQFGFSLEDTVATLALFDQNAIRGAEGGNALKTMLLRLGAPVEKAANAMEDLGIAVYDSAGNVKPASQLFEQLRTKLADLSDEERNMALSTIFGNRAIRGAAIAVKEGSEGFGKYRDLVNDAGAASRFASVQMDNLSGDLERLRGSIETGLIGAGSGATDTLRGLAQGAESAVDTFGKLPPQLQGSVGIIAGLSGTALLAGGSMAILAPAVAKANAQLALMGPLGAGASKGLLALRSVGPAALGIFAVATALDFLGDKAVEALKGTADVGELSSALVTLAKDGRATGAVAEEFGGDLGKLADKIKTVQNAAKATGPNFLHPTAMKNAKKDVDALDKALADLASSGPQGAIAAAQAFDKMAIAAGQEGVEVDELVDQFNDYTDAAASVAGETKLTTAAVSDTGKAAGTAASSTADLTKHQQELRDAADEAADALKKELDYLTGLTDVNLAVSNSNIGVIQAQGDLRASLLENGKSFDVNTEAGQKNQEALNGAIAAATEHAAAVGVQSGSVELATQTLQGHRQGLINTAVQMGVNKDQATLLVDTLLRFPPKVAPEFSTPGLPQAVANVQTFRDSINNIRALGETVVRARFELNDPFNLRGNMLRRAGGGPVAKDTPYEVGEKGAELFVPTRHTPGARSAAAKLATQADAEARDGLVRLGIPGGIEPKASRVGTQALLLGKDGPQMFTPPTDGVVVKASDTARLLRTEDEDIIRRILKRAGADPRTLDALESAPARASGGPVKRDKTYVTGEQGTEAFVPAFAHLATKSAAATPMAMPGITRGVDGSYSINVGDTHLTVEANTTGSTRGVSKSEVDAIVARHQAAMANELARSLEQGKR